MGGNDFAYSAAPQFYGPTSRLSWTLGAWAPYVGLDILADYTRLTTDEGAPPPRLGLAIPVGTGYPFLGPVLRLGTRYVWQEHFVLEAETRLVVSSALDNAMVMLGGGLGRQF